VRVKISGAAVYFNQETKKVKIDNYHPFSDYWMEFQFDVGYWRVGDFDSCRNFVAGQK
jgi:hypothetical protein